MSKSPEEIREHRRQYYRDYYQRNKDKYKGGTEYYRNNREKAQASNLRRYQIKRESRLLVTSRHRAKKLGLPFNIEISDIVIPEKCPYLSITLSTAIGGKPLDSSPSLDKIIPELGYVKGNIEVISWRANKLKNNATSDELLLIGSRLKTLETNRPK